MVIELSSMRSVTYNYFGMHVLGLMDSSPLFPRSTIPNIYYHDLTPNTNLTLTPNPNSNPKP